jgi:phasin family protein
MTSIPEQLTAVRNRQFDAQLDFMRTMTAQAFATAEQVLALNINTTRASVERTADTVRQLFSVTDPRDLFSVGSHTQEQLSSLFAYGRELASIAADARMNLARGALTQAAPQPEQPPAAPAEAAPRAAAPAAAAAAQAGMLAPVTQAPEAADAEAQDEIPANARQIAKAVGKVAGHRSELPHPSTAMAPGDDKADVQLPQIKPADLPPAAASAFEMKQPASKSSRKK